jgi:hypothetical protein
VPSPAALPATRQSADGQHASAPPAGIPRLARQRRRSVLALGIVLVCLGGLAAAYLVSTANHRVPVLVAATNIPVGAVITSADLATAEISATAGVATIPARQESQVTGRQAAVDVRQGTLIAASEVTTAVQPATGQVLVPVALKSWQLPASGLVPGDQVLIIPTPGAAGQAGAAAGAAPMTSPVLASVYQVSAPDQAGNVTADLLMTATTGPQVAKQASTGQISLIETPRRP